MTDDRNEERRQPTRSLEDMVVPRRPAGIPYGDGDDYDARALLLANGYTEEAGDLLGLLTSDLAILQAAAARTLGATGRALGDPCAGKPRQQCNRRRDRARTGCLRVRANER